MEPETGPEQRATRAEQRAPRGELRGDRLRRHAHRTGLYTWAGALVVLLVVVIAPALSREQRSTVRRLKRALLLGVMLALLGAGCGGGTLGAKALMQQSKSLRSQAAEGALLAQDVASGRTTRVYTREHSSDLYKSVSQSEASLKAAKTESALEPELRQLAVLAARVRADLDRLGKASKDEARALGRELQAAAEESQKIGEGLK